MGPPDICGLDTAPRLQSVYAYACVRLMRPRATPEGSIHRLLRSDPSGGAVFTREFPFAAASESSHPAAAPERIDGGCRVLLIDDDLDNLDALKEVLVLSGHSVEVARSGEEGLERIRTVPN